MAKPKATANGRDGTKDVKTARAWDSLLSLFGDPKAPIAPRSLLQTVVIVSLILHIPAYIAMVVHNPRVVNTLNAWLPHPLVQLLPAQTKVAPSDVRGPDGLFGAPWSSLSDYVCDTSFSGVEIISRDPLLIRIDNFLRTGEAEHLINVSKPLMARSTVVVEDSKDSDYEKRRRLDNARTSSSAFLERNGDPVIRCIEQRAVAFSGVPLENTEPMQVVHYDPEQVFFHCLLVARFSVFLFTVSFQHYAHHFDWFPAQFLETENRGGQRVTTFFVYLNSLPESAGGATNFPHASKHIAGMKPPGSAKGVDVHPTKGSATFWWDTDLQGNGDDRTLHSGTPPTNGEEKWGLNIWQRVGTFN
ncbi:hypothetical protein M427DRAFT_310929 [Gonapodya prolifera JEL478]|uniref:Prolyl 4-hydroxylase alpha subunit domain-containing protein n=1 Tax=Gonapodya prolifera (strain JEL478) TaxID=1344416 RepID=A0A139AWH7_GONPJ|nr:hypothetical protein M427DRAFT_310929 [Gonapodya prolifera JEL478]|eukprot:KXS21080.1 hypothetical protein M427DRAFT_310929 [Gonapodya prolifera JEL478]